MAGSGLRTATQFRETPSPAGLRGQAHPGHAAPLCMLTCTLAAIKHQSWRGLSYSPTPGTQGAAASI